MASMLAGDPTRTDVAAEDMTWTVRCDEYFTVSAANLAQQPLSFGYLVRESDRHTPEQPSHRAETHALLHKDLDVWVCVESMGRAQ